MRFCGKVGYGETTEIRPGIYDDTITERIYYGDVIRNSRRMNEVGDRINNDISVGNRISVVADEFAYEHFFQMRYVEWNNVLWEISEVEVERPRLILSLGGVYHGPTP